MNKTAVLVAPGFEEGETLTIADILRRAEIDCRLMGLAKEVTGGHGITVLCDGTVEDIDQSYNMIILPGGYDGVENLCKSETVTGILKDTAARGDYIAAICAAPVVLEKAGLLEGKKFTAYMGYDEKIKSGTFLEDKIVIDGNLITSRGPATAYAFAYKLVDLLGGDSLAVKNRMVYFNAFDGKEDE